LRSFQYYKIPNQPFRYPRLNDEYTPGDVMSFKNGEGIGACAECGWDIRDRI